MTLSTCLHCSPQISVALRDDICAALSHSAVALDALPEAPHGFVIFVFTQPDTDILSQLRQLCATADVLAVAAHALDAGQMWAVLNTGATDLLLWPSVPCNAEQISARLQRRRAIQQLVDSGPVRDMLAGSSRIWRNLMKNVVEVAAFTDTSVLITGETGTGKELLARLVHQLDCRPDKGELITLDCTTIAPELSGSEFFGHERGSYTGAANARDGAFALADGGVLFLDEVGELSLAHQAQLLRVIQEKKYKRIGSNVWQKTEFRLVCATNRDLEEEVAKGRFRADLFYRIAAWRCRTPSLRERREDILPLAQHFLSRLTKVSGKIGLDPAVRDYLLTRDYPGNVRDLRQTVTRLWHRHCGPGPLTIGDVPQDERLQCGASAAVWPDAAFLNAIRHAVALGVGLKEIGQIAADMAMQVVLEQEKGNVQRAALRLGVTDRALQMRLANARPAVVRVGGENADR